MMRALCLSLVSALLALPAAAQEVRGDAVLYTVEGDLADAAFGVESAILDEGLTIDHVSNVGEMLVRTGPDVGATGSPVGEAKVYAFCSATVSREVMEADPINILHCPYTIFVAQIDGATVIGHRAYTEDSMQPVQALLERIAQAAIQ